MDEITFEVSRDEESGWLIASWDAPNGSGGITTQGQDLRDLQAQVVDAVAAHFDDDESPQRIRPQTSQNDVCATHQAGHFSGCYTRNAGRNRR